MRLATPKCSKVIYYNHNNAKVFSTLSQQEKFMQMYSLLAKYLSYKNVYTYSEINSKHNAKYNLAIFKISGSFFDDQTFLSDK